MGALERAKRFSPASFFKEKRISIRKNVRSGLAAIFFGAILLSSCIPVSTGGELISPETGVSAATNLEDVYDSITFLKLNFSQMLDSGNDYKTCSGVFVGPNQISTIAHCIMEDFSDSALPILSIDYLFSENKLTQDSKPTAVDLSNRIVTFYFNNLEGSQKSFIPISDNPPETGETLYLITINQDSISMATGEQKLDHPVSWPFIFSGETINYDYGDCASQACYLTTFEADKILKCGNSGSPILRYNTSKRQFEVVGFASGRFVGFYNNLFFILASEK
ncbi:hypothetical protein A2774_00890 [Candidatus Roizmanbacteria bacterium RIFCSPHIGHO2_01_FULL_39_12c]|uniref:Peptidase S1 domain-containing protein n=1 Tax=Candidatus Roizmanbacteria bacterium RIFCSPHIGHO2_01_FULL_39_12c TaxID=1802031 RepID=A0A1F7GF37_9BACT|nr:MAG: hypothetical protein A2774_00890 [Candidatus Roizmanbacteria bacterium RIFCSPHIGHO2_01_FULL_39_12c]OGK46547.1 MAG: hypothetical protein A2963_02305 [Candidatus Roizmanbacteria bacterium RIFCSPLOWO2_01_FULL_40_13]